MLLRTIAAIVIAGALASGADTADAVLARMDKEAADFKQITARLKKTEYTAVLNDTSAESGSMSLKRGGRGIVMRAEFIEPNARSVSVVSNTAEIFYPKINTVQIYDLGKLGGLVDQFLVLGFGSSGKDIAKNYTVKLGGEESINGEKSSRLELVPKAAKVLEQIKKVELWIPADAGHPVQQRFLQPGGDYYLVTYSDLKLNPGLPDTAFQLNLPAGVRKEYPQK
jgi:outer membrane lipoprotein-sorting protein